MTRRLQPPKYPVTGNPAVDNELRNSWREHRNWLISVGNSLAMAATSGGAAYWQQNPPRKAKKGARKELYLAAFQYHPSEHYTPQKVLL